MWTCSKCNRIFDKEGQPHSCKKISLEQHFKNKDKARELFDYLVTVVDEKIGSCKVISLPCCIHLYGKYDFLAALPKRDSLEVRFSLNRRLTKARVCVPVSAKSYKNCFDIGSKDQFDKEFVDWLTESYYLKEINADKKSKA